MKVHILLLVVIGALCVHSEIIVIDPNAIDAIAAAEYALPAINKKYPEYAPVEIEEMVEAYREERISPFLGGIDHTMYVTMKLRPSAELGIYGQLFFKMECIVVVVTNIQTNLRFYRFWKPKTIVSKVESVQCDAIYRHLNEDLELFYSSSLF